MKALGEGVRRTQKLEGDVAIVGTGSVSLATVALRLLTWNLARRSGAAMFLGIGDCVYTVSLSASIAYRNRAKTGRVSLSLYFLRFWESRSLSSPRPYAVGFRPRHQTTTLCVPVYPP